MAKAGAAAGVSLRSKDAVQVGLFAGGECELTFEFGIFDYGNRGKHPALITSFKDENGETHEEPYGVGKGWDINRDGSMLIPKNGQTGLPNSCDAMLYMLTPMEDALAAAGIDFPEGSENGDITSFNGLVAIVARKPVQERDFGDKSQKRDESKGPKTKLVITEIISAPWAEGAKPGKGKPAAAAPTKGAAKGKPAEADAEVDEEVDALAAEALIEALDDNKGPLDVDELEAALLKQLKGNPQRKEIAARAAQSAFLAECDGVTYNSRKGTVALA